MGGCGLEDGKAIQALDAVEERLATKYGLVLIILLTPNTILNMVKFLLILRDIRKMPVSSVITMHGLW